MLKNFKRNIINNNQYVPISIIFVIDLIVVTASFIITYLLFELIRKTYVDYSNLPLAYSLYLFVNIICFYTYKTYHAIVRHFNIVESINILLLQLTSFVILVSINYAILFTSEYKFFLTIGLFINFIFSFIFLFFYRIAIRLFFDYTAKNSSLSKLENVLVYGLDSNAIAVANALQLEVPKRFNLVGFYTISDKNINKKLLNKPIYSATRKVSNILRKYKCDGIIITKISFNDELQSIVNDCLDFNFKVYRAPSIDKWDDGKSFSKTIENIKIQDLLNREEIILDKQRVKNELKDKTILVSGGAGSIGTEIVRQLAKFDPKKIIILDQAETPLHNFGIELHSLSQKINIELQVKDIREQDTLKAIFEHNTIDIIYHAAAYKHVPLMEEHPEQAVKTNILGTKNLAELAMKYEIKKFVMVSTDKAVNPSNVMGASKRIAEIMVSNFQKQQSVTKFITTRFGNVLGSNGSVVPLFQKQIEAGGPITITHPDIIRYFMTIPEACQLVLEAGVMGHGGEIFIFDMGKPVRIKDLALKMIKLAGLKYKEDIDIEYIGLRPGEKLYEELLKDESKNLPTYHHKIMIATELFVNLPSDILEKLIKVKDSTQIVSLMKNIVPEFKSLNSKYEILDKKKQST